MTAAYATSDAQAVATTVASVTVTKPASVASGDLLVAYCWANNNQAVWTPPASPAWSNGDQDSTKGSAIFYRFADGSEGADFTFTRSVNTTAASGVVMVRITGADSIAASDCSSAGSGTNLVLTGVTAAQADTLLLQFANTLTTTADTWAPPGTATERVDTTSSGIVVRYAIGDEVVGSGATGNRTWTHTNGQTSKGALVAINPGGTPATMTATAGDADAAGGTATLTGAGTMTATSGNADGAGGTAALSGAGTMTATAADATADGAAATMIGDSGDATLTTIAGNATAEGGTATLTGAASLAATAGDATAAGGDAALTGAATFATTAGNADTAGGTATLSGAATFSATSATASASGGTATLTGAAAMTAVAAAANATGGLASMLGVDPVVVLNPEATLVTNRATATLTENAAGAAIIQNKAGATL